MTHPQGQQAETLKPCPFCGGVAVCRAVHRAKRYLYIALCDDCFISTCPAPKEVAIETWNRRAPPSPQPAQPQPMSDKDMRKAARDDNSCVGAFARARPKRVPK